MLNYKKKPSINIEKIPDDQKKDSRLQMSGIMEQKENKHINDLSHGQANGIRTISEPALITGIDQKRVDLKINNPLQTTQLLGGVRSESNQINGIANDFPYAMIPPSSFKQTMLNHVKPINVVQNRSNISNFINGSYNQQTIDKNSIIVETNYDQKKFLFYDINKNYIGGFSSHQFIRFITSHTSPNFLKSVDIDSVKPIIEKYICKIHVVEKTNKKYIINMNSYIESPFMGNIETLIKFYTFIQEFEENKLQSELNKLNIHESIKTKEIFNIMLYSLLNHIFNIITILINKLNRNDTNTSKMRDSLLNYSVIIVHRLSKLVRTDIDVKTDELAIFNQDLSRVDTIRTDLSSKLELIQKTIDKQNAVIDVVLRNVLIVQTMAKSLPNESDEFMKEIAEPSEITTQSSDYNSSGKPTTEKISTTSDKSHIFIDNTKSNNKPVILSSSGIKTSHESLRISDVLNEVGKLKNISENISENITHNIPEKQDDLNSHQSSNFTGGSAKSLSDILMLHQNVNSDTDDSENLGDGIDIDDDENSQFKYLSISSNPNLSAINID